MLQVWTMKGLKAPGRSSRQPPIGAPRRARRRRVHLGRGHQHRPGVPPRAGPRRPPVGHGLHRQRLRAEDDRPRGRPLRDHQDRVPRPARRAGRDDDLPHPQVQAGRPEAGSDAGDESERPLRPRPSINRDNAFWFEGAENGQAPDPAVRGLRAAASSPRARLCGLRVLRVGRRRGDGARHRLQLHDQPPPADPGLRLPAGRGPDRAGGGHAPGRPTSSASTPTTSRSARPCRSSSPSSTTSSPCPSSAPCPRRADGLQLHRGTGRGPRPRRADLRRHGHRRAGDAEIEATDERFDRELWAQLAEAGLLGIGAARGPRRRRARPVESLLVLEQQGRRLAPVPYWSTVVVGAKTLVEFGTQAQQALVGCHRHRAIVIAAAGLDDEASPRSRPACAPARSTATAGDSTGSSRASAFAAGGRPPPRARRDR